jgi:hypothetical protein
VIKTRWRVAGTSKSSEELNINEILRKELPGMGWKLKNGAYTSRAIT